MKINRYAGAFLTGGAICFLCHFLTMAYRMAGVPELFAVSVTVFTLAAVGSVTTITGHYQKLTDFGGMGAMITMGGFSSAITDAVHGARKEGMGAGRALWRGGHIVFRIPGGCCVRCCDVCGWPDLAGLTIWKMGELIMELVKIFIAGGVFCMFGEVLWAKTGLGVVKTLMVCIAAGVALDVAGILGPVIGFGQEGFTVTIYGAGASIFDGVMGSVRDHGLSGIIRLTNFYFLRFSGLIVCTMAMAAVLGFLFPGTRGK